MAELHWMTAAEIASLIRKGELKPSELMAKTLARIEAINPKLNAFCALRAEEAMNDARALDDKIARREALGPLAGVPLAVKDLESVAGMATTYGSLPFKDNIAKEDSVEVARLRAAGAIVVGKTNTPEFGHTAFTKNLVYGVTRNPWNLERTPGGSSGGSSAAIASGMVPLATASDWGGSIRIPASFTGTFGLKPSQGRIPVGPRFGMTQWVDFSVVGPITRSVRDAALYMDAAAGYHPSDAASLPHPGISYAEKLDQLPRKLRIAFHPTLGYHVQRDIVREVTKAADAFKDMGHELTTLDEMPPEVGWAWARIGGPQTVANLWPQVEKHREQFGRAFVANMEAAAKITWIQYGDAWRARTEINEWAQRVFERFDILVIPTMPLEAFDPKGPPPSEIEGHRLDGPLKYTAFTYPFNMTGHPAASVRAGMTDHGLPCGLQIIAQRHRDDLVLQAAHAFETARPWNSLWPDI